MRDSFIFYSSFVLLKGPRPGGGRHCNVVHRLENSWWHFFSCCSYWTCSAAELVCLHNIQPAMHKTELQCVVGSVDVLSDKGTVVHTNF
jgi:hypothetical protein